MFRTDSLEAEIVSALRRIAQAMELRSRDLLSGHGMTGPQLTALRIIGSSQPISAGAVARGMHLSQATVTGILHRLEQRELLRRSRTASDRRNVLLCLTEKGQHTVRSAPSLLRDQFREQLSRLADWEQTAILSTLQRLAHMMHAEDLSNRPDRSVSLPVPDGQPATRSTKLSPPCDPPADSLTTDHAPI